MNQDLLLHVEDDLDDALLIGRALSKAGIENPVQVVENAERAVQYLLGRRPFAQRGSHPLPGLVLLDLNTPLMTGHGFLRWRQEQPPEIKRIPVIVLTSSDAETDVAAAYDAGANAYLVKPLDHTRMVAMLRDLHAFWFNWNRTERLVRKASG